MTLSVVSSRRRTLRRPPSDANLIVMKAMMKAPIPPKHLNAQHVVVKQISDKNAALLLASLAAIASKEIDVNSNALDERDESTHALFEARVRKISFDYEQPTGSITNRLKYSHRNNGRVGTLEHPVKNNSVEDHWHAIVSDSSSPNTPVLSGKQPDYPTAKELDGIPTLAHDRSSQTSKGRDRNVLQNDSLVTSHQENLDKLHPEIFSRNTKTILRRKFSWKNYPELESFLIANREEYLRHSALNYTVQQKQYNNRLTERLVELAMEHGYVFDEKDFSFVSIRDRIRCYYKSYVQSSKKRGVIIGYAARRAGLLTKEELKSSAEKTGKIICPMKNETMD